MFSALREHEIVVLCVRPDELSERDLDDARGWLSDVERAQFERFRGVRLRGDYLATRWLQRRGLSAHTGIDPAAWHFDVGTNGRPEIAAPLTHRHLRFNLSNTEGLIAIGLSWKVPIGIDAEWTERPAKPLALADRYFAREEAAALRALPAADQRARFFQYWTLKEAYLKAIGTGLRTPLDEFEVRLDPAPIGIVFHAPAARDLVDWQLQLLDPTPHHLLALAVPREAPLLTRAVSLKWCGALCGSVSRRALRSC